ncbi:MULTISPECIES: hypothetical protein [Maribacter]|jgi:hypothetical protein|uniref:Uncharacterized protein n=1 Tax=Maribacter stanieri TaxID=440514 RepID=A0A1I6I970_9FLAO|nr:MULTISPECIES: hypothetical protein [Maribacter]SFR63256.1 hypothetical protein SAMN04488010_1321 [Maribacter stanieri]|tara:strand:- start:53 stop:385 length:333 start_codon:yes stop_codon:yes gene_type:complete
MKLSPKVLKILLIVVLLGFGIGFYVQDLKHEESTAHAWKANRYNLDRFNKIMEYNKKMNSSNWRVLKDSIDQQLDTLMILRFRKEVDSLDASEPQAYSDQVEVHASFGPQ